MPVRWPFNVDLFGFVTGKRIDLPVEAADAPPVVAQSTLTKFEHFRPVWNSPGSARPVDNPLGRLLGRARRTAATQAFGAHAIAQNAHHQTDTDIPDRHTALNPRALAVQADASDRTL